MIENIPPQQVPNVVADNRRCLQIVGSAVYYAFYTDTHVGVRGRAGGSTLTIPFSRDGRSNRYGLAYSVDADNVRGAVSFVEDGRSQVLAFEVGAL